MFCLLLAKVTCSSRYSLRSLHTTLYYSLRSHALLAKVTCSACYLLRHMLYLLRSHALLAKVTCSACYSLRSLHTTLYYSLRYMLEQLEKQNALELDYRIEADNLHAVGANMKRHGFSPGEVRMAITGRRFTPCPRPRRGCSNYTRLLSLC